MSSIIAVIKWRLMKFKEILEWIADKKDICMPHDINREKDTEKTVSKHRAPRFRFTRGEGDSFSLTRPSEHKNKETLDTSGSVSERRQRSERRKTMQRRNAPVLTEEVLSSDPRFIGRVFSVEVQDVRLPDGRLSKREVVRHPGGACVVALDDEQNLFLVRQHRVGTGDTTRELPAGKLDIPEDPLECARRELAEETSVIAEQWDLLSRYYPSPGYTDEVISIYLARGLSKAYARPDDGEFLTVEKIHLTDALNQIRDGLITDGKTCLGIYMAADFIGYFTR